MFTSNISQCHQNLYQKHVAAIRSIIGDMDHVDKYFFINELFYIIHGTIKLIHNPYLKECLDMIKFLRSTIVG